MAADGVNAAQVERWSGPGGRHWVDHEADYDHQLAACGTILLDAARLAPTDQVLDVGCGTGTTAIIAAGRSARVLGIDLSPVMIERARTRAEGHRNVAFDVADAQTARFEPEFDVLISRFGLMFFDDPPAAFANLRQALWPGGRLATVCWQALEDNDWMRVPGEALASVVPLGNLAEPGQPGPFSLASRPELTRLLTDAGWDDVVIEGWRLPLPIGPPGPVDAAVEFLRGGSLARSALGGASPETEERALAALHDALVPYATEDGVVLGGAGWTVQAVNRRR